MKDTIMNYISYTFYFQLNTNLILKCYGITGISILYIYILYGIPYNS